MALCRDGTYNPVASPPHFSFAPLFSSHSPQFLFSFYVLEISQERRHHARCLRVSCPPLSASSLRGQ